MCGNYRRFFSKTEMLYFSEVEAMNEKYHIEGRMRNRFILMRMSG